jgi:hypothetical protein
MMKQKTMGTVFGFAKNLFRFEKYYYSGDFFGEAAITGDGLRLAK